jgi:hypothetical protein
MKKNNPIVDQEPIAQLAILTPLATLSRASVALTPVGAHPTTYQSSVSHLAPLLIKEIVILIKHQSVINKTNLVRC